jgi:Tetratricopeptide repeat
MIIRTDTGSGSFTNSGSTPTGEDAQGEGAAIGVVLDGDRTALAEERDFLLRSLRDLEAEFLAGDIGEVDYQNLRDDYTARAAAVLRTLADEPSGFPNGATGHRGADGRARQPVERSRGRWRTSAIVGGILLVGVLAAWAVTASSGSRLANQPITGTLAGPKATSGSSGQGGGSAAGLDPRLLQAGQLVQKGKLADALKLYDQILKDRPNDPQALASEGWLIAQAGMSAGRADLVDQGLAKLQAAEKADPTYPTAHFFRGTLLLQAKADPAGAVTELRMYLGMVDPASPEVPQVEQLLRTALAAAGPNVPPGPNAPTTTAAP